MPRWSQFMERDEHSPGMETIGDSKLEIAAGGLGCSSKSKSYGLSRPDSGGAWQHVRSHTAIDLQMSLKGPQCSGEGRARPESQGPSPTASRHVTLGPPLLSES